MVFLSSHTPRKDGHQPLSKFTEGLSTLVVGFAFLVLVSAYFIHNPSSFSRPQPPPPGEPHWKYKPTPPPKPPVIEHFPRAASAKAPSDLPSVPSWNTPPSPHVNESTPLFIGFARTWELLQQCVVSYIAAGWPPGDIYVVENTGTMDANRLGRLTLQNPLYLDYKRLTDAFGVNVITAPTLLSFAQLQNLFLYIAISNGWDHYFWGHMDVAVLSNEAWEDPETGEYKNLYMRAVDDIREARRTRDEPDDQGRTGGWAIRFYAYDRLALVNRTAFEQVGGWDPMIPYYATDCDMHSRLFMSGFKQGDVSVGRIFDVAGSLEDVELLYHRDPVDPRLDDSDPDLHPTLADILPEDVRGGAAFEHLQGKLQDLNDAKGHGDRLRWQGVQQGGQGEPYYRDAEGFQQSIVMLAEQGKKIMAEKWGHRGCNLKGLKFEDAWKVEHDWE
ncbi:hypothetical protein LTR09_001262 [Extremus antarcticus]|uniref:Uncharacterized protein n=1 Tax=Extremus antarcticus TaxID=702011 RepID=A0AAJ0GIF2_9PEZI|nr:hypothetical protein LTR09_001262 [Extremus antarcticus]